MNARHIPVVAGLLAAAAVLAAAPESPAPFRAGERLAYQVRWASLNAATAELEAVAERQFRGRAAWHLRAQARTVEAVRLLYPLDDQFDSYADAATLASLQYEMRKREAGRREDTTIRMTHEGDPAGEGPSVRVPRGTRDPLGFFYFLRTADWRRTPEVRSTVYDGEKLYEVRARLVEARERVAVPAGGYDAAKLALRVFERGRELTDARFRVWLANDAARTPVLIEAELPFGALRVELRRAE
jgi:hypothetical protein